MSKQFKKILPDVISHSQDAFVAGRSILNNILICQDLVPMYSKKQSRASCLMKLGLRKVYDTVNCNFIQKMMKGLDFRKKLIW